MLASGRNVGINIDRIDTWPETVLGLFSTCFCTLFIWLCLLPLFHIGGMPWIKTWEGKHAVLYPKALEGECTNAMRAKYVTPAQAFAAMDTSDSATVNQDEWTTFAWDLNSYLTAHGKDTMRVMPCYQEYDLHLSGEPFVDEAFYSVVGSKYHWADSLNVVKLRMAFAKQFGSMAAACDTIMDTDNSTTVTLSEFQNATAKLAKPPTDRNGARLFSRMDTDSDGVLSMPECHFRAAGFKLRLKNTYTNLTSGCNHLDTDKNGMISLPEFMIQSKLLSPPLHDSDAKVLFPQLDLNHDGSISVFPECHIDFAEFGRRVAAAGGCTIFKDSDTDKNGVLTAREFVELGAHLVPPVDATNMAELFEEVDKDKDYVIQPTEMGCGARIQGTMQFTAFVPKGMKTGNKTIDGWFETALGKVLTDNGVDSAKAKEVLSERRLADEALTPDETPAPTQAPVEVITGTTPQPAPVVTPAPTLVPEAVVIETTPPPTTTATNPDTPLVVDAKLCPSVTADTADGLGMKSVTIDIKYDAHVEAPERVKGSLEHEKRLTDTTSDEFVGLKEQLARVGVCVESATELTPPVCYGEGCPGWVATTTQPLVTTAAATAAPTTPEPTPAPTTPAPTVEPEVKVVTTEEATTKKPDATTQEATTTPAVTTTPEVITTAAATTSEAAGTTTPAVTTTPEVAPAVTEAATTPAATTPAATTPGPTVAPVFTTPAGVEVDTPITALNLPKYNTKQANLNSLMQLYMEPNAFASQGLTWPSDAVLASQITPVIDGVLTEFSETQIAMGGAVVGTLVQGGGLESTGTRNLGREVNITWSANVADGGKIMDKLRRWGDEFTAKIVDGLTAKSQVPASGMLWLNYVTIHQYTEVVYSYTAIEGGQPGDMLKQLTGHQRGKVLSESGSFAFKVNYQR